jgi:peptidoglycan/LPS O-acetylase OafA/YrhL
MQAKKNTAAPVPVQHNEQPPLQGHRPNLRSLTALRFFAAAMIVMYHLRGKFIPIRNFPENYGIMGVSFFFVLSGFVMALCYPAFSHKREALCFLWNRIIRIYPLHLATFCISLHLLYIEKSPWEISTALINIFLLQSYWPFSKIFLSFNGVAWTLSVQLCFYLVFAVANFRPKNIIVVCIISGASLIGSMAFLEQTNMFVFGWLYKWSLYILPINRLLVCLLGIGAFKIIFNRLVRLRTSINRPLATLLELLAVASLIDFIYWGELTRWIDYALTSLHFPCARSLTLFNKTYIASVVPALLTITIFGLERGYVSWLLTGKAFVLLGELSFALFMSHNLIIKYFTPYRDRLYKTIGWVSTTALLLLLLLVCAWLLYKTVEDPMRKRLRLNWPSHTL